MDKECNNCVYYEVDDNPALGIGLCKRFPPVIVESAINHPALEAGVSFKFQAKVSSFQPGTWFNNFCGEWVYDLNSEDD